MVFDEIMKLPFTGRGRKVVVIRCFCCIAAEKPKFSFISAMKSIYSFTPIGLWNLSTSTAVFPFSSTENVKRIMKQKKTLALHYEVIKNIAMHKIDYEVDCDAILCLCYMFINTSTTQQNGIGYYFVKFVPVMLTKSNDPNE